MSEPEGYMDADEFKAIRHELGLSISQMAAMLSVNEDYVRKMELPPAYSGAKPIRGPTARLMLAYSHGYRTHDWPEPRRG